MTRSLLTVLEEANPNKLPDAFRRLRIGTALGLVARTARVTVVAGTGIGALPEGAKAVAIVRCFVSFGGVTGFFTPLATSAAPATTQVGVSPLGDLRFLIADAVTEAEVTYFAAEGGPGVVYTDDIVVASNSGILPGGRKARILLSATDITGGGSVAKTVVARGGAVAAGQANIFTDPTTIVFGDAGVTKARVRYVAFPSELLDTAIRSDVTF